MKKLRLKKWVKVVLYLICIIVIVITIKDMFTKKEVVITEGKNYTCNGNFILKVCSGSDYDAR